MKPILLLVLGLMWTGFYSPYARAGEKNKKKETSQNEIHWLSLNEAETLMAKKPKKVIVDVYTSWCGWCKVMDKKTYEHPDVIKYINQNFYAVKLDAEQKEAINFKGRVYSFMPEQRVNAAAIELLGGRMSYPTTVFMDENFENAQPVPGYLSPDKLELVIKYVGGNHHKSTTFSDFQKSFVSTWTLSEN